MLHALPVSSAEMTSGPVLDTSAYDRVKRGHVVYGAAVYVDYEPLPDEALKGLSLYGNDAVAESVRFSLRTLLSRPNLEAVMRVVDLDQGVETDAERERILQQLRELIRIQYSGPERTVRIYCAHSDAATAERVTKVLLTLFLDGAERQIRLKMERTERTVDRLIARYQGQLSSLEHPTDEHVVAVKRDVLSRLLYTKEKIDLFSELLELMLRFQVIVSPRLVQ